MRQRLTGKARENADKAATAERRGRAVMDANNAAHGNAAARAASLLVLGAVLRADTDPWVQRYAKTGELSGIDTPIMGGASPRQTLKKEASQRAGGAGTPSEGSSFTPEGGRPEDGVTRESTRRGDSRVPLKESQAPSSSCSCCGPKKGKIQVASGVFKRTEGQERCSELSTSRPGVEGSADSSCDVDTEEIPTIEEILERGADIFGWNLPDPPKKTCPRASDELCVSGASQDVDPMAKGEAQAETKASVVILGKDVMFLSSPMGAGLVDIQEGEECQSVPRQKLNQDPGRLRDLPVLVLDPDELEDKAAIRRKLKRWAQEMGFVDGAALTCGCRRAPIAEEIKVWEQDAKTPAGQRLTKAHYRGLESCGRVHECVSCGLKRAMKNVYRIGQAASAHIAAGGALYMATFTIPHADGDDTKKLFRVLAEAWRRVASGRRQAFGPDAWSGWIRAFEVTYGANGAHPHYHVLFFAENLIDGTHCPPRNKPDEISKRLLPQVQREISPEEWDTSDLALYWSSLVHRWTDAVKKAGKQILGRELLALPEQQHLQSVNCLSSLPRYLAKSGLGAGFELGFAPGKVGRTQGSRTPFQILLDLALNGNYADLALWRKHAAAMRGLSQITASRSSKKSEVERNPFKRYENAPPFEFEREDGWVLSAPRETYGVRDWLYQALWRQELDGELLRQHERLGAYVVADWVRLTHSACPGRHPPSIRWADSKARALIDKLRSIEFEEC